MVQSMHEATIGVQRQTGYTNRYARSATQSMGVRQPHATTNVLFYAKTKLQTLLGLVLESLPKLTLKLFRCRSLSLRRSVCQQYYDGLAEADTFIASGSLQRNGFASDVPDYSTTRDMDLELQKMAGSMPRSDDWHQI